ncbi:MAG: hypothetical protein ACI9R3_000793 [Verrucomicrobiales bacterium]|jgi:hypothetical protein
MLPAIAITALTIAVSTVASLNAATLVGLWEFDNAANPAQATVGANLAFEGSAPTHSASLADDGGSLLSGTITTAPNTSDNRISAAHGILGNGGGEFVNQYTIVADIFSPASSRDSWRTIFQTNTSNEGDGEYFIRPNNDHIGVGDLTYSNGPIDETSWTRFVLTVDLSLAGNDVNAYLDGALFFSHPVDSALDNRFSLDPSIYFFTDNDGDNAPLNVGALAIYDGALTVNEVTGLGAAGSAIPEPSSAMLLTLASIGLAMRRRRS